MKRGLIPPILFLLVGCDAVFVQRMDVHEAVDRGQDTTMRVRLGAAVDRVALRMGLACRAGPAPAVRLCSAQPRTLTSVASGDRGTVCFRMMGIPLERWKFERQAQLLEDELVAAFGRESVASVQGMASECTTVPPTVPLERAGAASREP